MSIERDIAHRFERHDSQAGKLLYETYGGWLLGVCLRYVADRSLAQDLLHDGFVQILTHTDQFRWQGDGSLRAWVFRVQQNVILTHLRHRGLSAMMLSTEEVPVSDIPEPETVSDIPRHLLMQFISELPVGYRTVFNMHVIDGFSHKEIAQRLGIQEKSSSSQLFHAKRLLASKINLWRKENL